MIIHEVQQVLWVETEHGRSQVLFIMDYGIHENTIWVCVNNNGEIRHYNTTHIKIEKNYTIQDSLSPNWGPR